MSAIPAITAAKLTALMKKQPASPAAQAEKKEVIVRVGTIAPQGTPWEKMVQRMGRQLKEKSNGRIRLKPYYGGALGAEELMAQDVKRGSIHMFGGSTAALSAVVPELAIFELPYLFHSFAETDYIMDSVLLDDVKKLLDERGLIFYMWTENGWRNFGTKFGCIASPSDFKDKTMRVQPISTHIAMYKALGAQALVTPATEVQQMLTTGVVDGFDNTPLFSWAASWYTVVKYYTLSRHIYQPALIVISKVWLEGQDEEIKQALLAPVSAADVKWARKSVRGLDKELIENFRKAGITVCDMTAEQRETFAKATRPSWDTFRRQDAKSRKLLEKVEKALADFRNKQ
jgi:TRAP-type C4-dicarboxylate transport system substrate-binding protein